ncbi:MAG: FAD:protein FMN transferase [Clostridia bacterium]|nr:FAD:protein FMN transferase [Clostridia bacterium]
MKRILAVLLLAAVLAIPAAVSADPQRYTYTFYGTFDTVMTLIGYADSQEQFDRAAALCESEFRRLDALYTPYLHSEAGTNLWSLNNGAWKEPMKVEPDMMNLLVFCRDLQEKYPGAVNIAMGRVLNLWHEARLAAEDNPAEAKVPDPEVLAEAAEHCDMSDLVLDEEAGTVFYRDPLLRLDLGAVAKGYAAGLVEQKLAELLPAFCLNAGGNIVLHGAPYNSRKAWRTGIQNPDALLYGDNTTLGTVDRTDGCIVTSGDYQRYFTVDGVRYHHIIDPVTLQPARSVRAVTIICENSGLADFLSTTCFILPYEESRNLVLSLDGVEALWVLPDGMVIQTAGFGLTLP